MSTNDGGPRGSESTPSPGVAAGPWPIGVRALLTVLGLLAALGMRVADRGVAIGPGAACRRAPVLVIDPNTAPPAVLGALPRVGPALVRRLVEARQVRPFASIEDLRRRVRGLGPATMAGLAPHLRIAHGGDQAAGPRGDLLVSIPAGSGLARGSGRSESGPSARSHSFGPSNVSLP